MSRPATLSQSRAHESPRARSDRRPWQWLVLAGLTLAAMLWSYWPVVWQLWRDWQVDENYSVGQLVPLAALYLVWRDRRALRERPIQPAWLGGLGVIVLAQLVRAYGLLDLRESIERYALVMTVWGVVLMAAGWPVFRRLKWVMLFLLLMVPLPGSVHNRVSGPLQSQATVGAVFLLELFGTTVLREGNVILLNDSVPLAVAEACSGLRMLTAFVVVAAVLAFLVNRPPWQKAALLVSSIPVAIVCNLVRLLVTAELYLLVNREVAETFFHDFAGLAMMPLAVGLLMGELWLMRVLVVPEHADSGDRPPQGGSAT